MDKVLLKGGRTMREIVISNEEFSRDELPLFRSPHYPILFPFVIFWVSVAESFVAWAALFGHWRVRQTEILFGSCHSESMEQDLDAVDDSVRRF